MYPASPDGRLPLRLKPTFANANATSPKAKISMISSVRRLPPGTGTSGFSGSTAGDGAVMLLTGASPCRPGRAAHHECPVVGGTMALAGISNAVDGGHMAPALAGWGPGLGMLFVGFRCRLARATLAW